MESPMDKQSVIDILEHAIGAIFAIGCFVAVVYFFNKQRRAMLTRWALENRLDILEVEERYFQTGPFKWWTTGRSQVVYRAIVRDSSGKEQLAWVRCGSWFIGGKQVEVRWGQLEGDE